MLYHIRQCTNAGCRFRFPAADNDRRGDYCPHCGAETVVTAVPTTHNSGLPSADLPPDPCHLEVLLDNIRSVYNVGAMFRTADGAGVAHLHLCGITAPPTHPKLAKTALGAESNLPWTQWRNGVETAVSLQQQQYQLWALESMPDAEPLFTARLTDPQRPILFIVGNEKVGVDPDILARCDRVFSLPMQGVKESLNVAVAFGIALYHIRFGMEKDHE